MALLVLFRSFQCFGYLTRLAAGPGRPALGGTPARSRSLRSALARAWPRPRREGARKPAVTGDKLRRAREHIAKGLNVGEASTRVKVGKTALYKALRAEPA